MTKEKLLVPFAVASLLAASPFDAANAACQTKSAYGAESDGNARSPSVPEGLDKPQETVWDRDTLTGDWGGLRQQLENKGFKLTTTLQSEFFGNTGGARQGAIADGLLNAVLDVDLERLTGFWKDATLHANALYIYGPGLSAQYVGDFSNTSNISGYNSVRLQELWLEQGFLDKRISLRAGVLAADTEFFTSESACLFINGTFGAFTLIGSNFSNAPIYPVANPGIRFNLAPTSNFYFKAAVFGMNSNSDPAGNNAHGTDWDINKSDGAMFITELGWLVNQSPNDRGLTGTYKLGSFVQHGNFTTWQSQAESALGTGPLSANGTNYAVYAVADQQIYVSGGKTVSAFARGGFAPSDYSFVSSYIDAGLNFTGFVPGRQNDVAGIAFARSGISGDYSNSQQLQGGASYSGEMVIEATYKAQIAPWWSIQPDLQYIVNPSGAQGSDNAFVVGVRTTIVF